MADGIDTFEIDGETYLIAANEGDAREYTVEEEGDAFAGGEILDLGRGDDLTLDATDVPRRGRRCSRTRISAGSKSRSSMATPMATATRTRSSPSADGPSRSTTPTETLVYDSGSLLAEIAAAFNADEFQGNDGALRKPLG